MAVYWSPDPRGELPEDWRLRLRNAAIELEKRYNLSRNETIGRILGVVGGIHLPVLAFVGQGVIFPYLNAPN
ncbi:MAG: hypothetical protein ACK4M3_05365 [Pyrobaculum sp.]